MTDNLQLQTTRLTNSSDGNLIDDSVVDIENCMSVLFGITKDSPVSPPMSISAAGNVTMIGNLTLAGAPTNVLHCATKKYVDDNASGLDNYICAVGDGVTTLAHTLDTLVTDALHFSSTPLVEIGSTDQFDYSSNPDRITCKSAGDYLILFHVDIDPRDYSESTQHYPCPWCTRPRTVSLSCGPWR
jgi:hypothetical protein